MPDLKLNLRTIAVVTVLGGFILAPSQSCVAGVAQQGTAGGPVHIDTTRPADESGRLREEGVTGHRFELVPHVKDGGKNIYIKTPFLYEEGPSEAPEPLWV